MMFTFTAALFAIASGAAGDSAASSVSQSLSPSEVHADALPKSYLRGGSDTTFVRRLFVPYGGFRKPYNSNTGCLDDQYHDKCWNCMCLTGGEGNPVVTMWYDLDANPDGQDHCMPKLAFGERCYYDWECLSNSCLGYGDLYCAVE